MPDRFECRADQGVRSSLGSVFDEGHDISHSLFDRDHPELTQGVSELRVDVDDVLMEFDDLVERSLPQLVIDVDVLPWGSDEHRAGDGELSGGSHRLRNIDAEQARKVLRSDRTPTRSLA